jgi:hypothetical protein
MNKKILVAIVTAGLGFGLYGAAQAYSMGGDRVAQLEKLGKQLDMSPAQQKQWAEIMDSAKQARTMSLQGLDTKLSVAIDTLNAPGADISQLFDHEADPNAQAAREHTKDLVLAFYADATPDQQKQMRDFLSERLTRLQRVLHKRAEMSLGA